MMEEKVLAQALVMTGVQEPQKRAALETMCAGAVLVLKAQLKDSVDPETCEAEFVAAASLMAVAAWEEAEEKDAMEEFRAGDLTVKRSSRAEAVRCLRQQARQIIGPFLKDNFCFTGV